MGKRITITAIDENLDPKISEQLTAHEGRLPDTGEVWVLFRDKSGRFDHLKIFSGDKIDEAINLASRHIAGVLEKGNIAYAEVYLRSA